MNSVLFCSPYQPIKYFLFELVHIHWFILLSTVGFHARNTKANCGTLLVHSGSQSLTSLRVYHTAQSRIALSSEIFPCVPLFFSFPFPSLHLKDRFFPYCHCEVSFIKSQVHVEVHARRVTCLLGHLEGEREHSRLSIRPESRVEEGRSREEKEIGVNGGGVHQDIYVGVGKRSVLMHWVILNRSPPTHKHTHNTSVIYFRFRLDCIHASCFS